MDLRWDSRVAGATKGFWSLTVYNPEHFFYPNALERFALGTKNKSLKHNDDGSLTIYLGNQSPGQEKEANWLPAPAGDFSIWIRDYWPDQAILDGTWKPPVVAKTKSLGTKLDSVGPNSITDDCRCKAEKHLVHLGVTFPADA